MEKNLTTEDQLKRDLEDLYRKTMAARTMGRNPNETQQHVDHMEMHWVETLEKERGLRLDQAKKDAQHVIEQQELDANKRERQLQDNAMKDLAEQKPRRPIFHATRGREELDPALADQRAQAAAQVFEPIEKQINGRYDRLRTGMESAIDSITEGKTPDLRFLLEQQREQEAKLTMALEKIRHREREEDREI
jgi:hypothetical protein